MYEDKTMRISDDMIDRYIIANKRLLARHLCSLAGYPVHTYIGVHSSSIRQRLAIIRLRRAEIIYQIKLLPWVEDMNNDEIKTYTHNIAAIDLNEYILANREQIAYHLILQGAHKPMQLFYAPYMTFKAVRQIQSVHYER